MLYLLKWYICDLLFLSIKESQLSRPVQAALPFWACCPIAIQSGSEVSRWHDKFRWAAVKVEVEAETEILNRKPKIWNVKCEQELGFRNRE